MNEAKHSSSPADGLREITLAFIAAHERREPLAVWLERYPQHARTLIDLAMTLDAAARQADPDPHTVTATANALREGLR